MNIDIVSFLYSRLKGDTDTSVRYGRDIFTYISINYNYYIVGDIPIVHMRNEKEQKSSTIDTFRSRVSSTYLRQLSKNIIPGSTLQLQETIGQGIIDIMTVIYLINTICNER